jgi:hypothetical protein
VSFQPLGSTTGVGSVWESDVTASESKRIVVKVFTGVAFKVFCNLTHLPVKNIAEYYFIFKYSEK